MKKCFNLIFPFILSLILIFNSSVPVFSSSVVEKLAYDYIDAVEFVWNNVFKKFGIALEDPNSAGRNFLNYLDGNWNDTHGGGGHSRGAEEFINDTVSVTDDDKLVYSDEFNEVLLTYIKADITNVSYGYSMQNIYSYTDADSTLFYNATQFNAFKNVCSQLGSQGFNFVFVPMYTSYASGYTMAFYPGDEGSTVKGNSKIVMYYDGTDNDLIDFYMSNGHVNNYSWYNSFVPTHNWTSIMPGNNSANVVTIPGWKFKIIKDDGTVLDGYRMFRPTFANLGGIRNTRANSNKGEFVVFNTTSRNMPIYAYDSIDAIKKHDTGQPAPYYLTSNFGSVPLAFQLSPAEYHNEFNPYNSIVNELSPNLSAGDLQNIINININSNGGGSSGGGSSGGDSDDDGIFDGLFDGLGSLIKSFFKGIGEIIGAIADGLGSLLESLTSVISNLVNSFTDEDGSIFMFLKSFLVWLPEPLPTILISTFVLCILFGVIRLIKGAFS